MTSPAIEGPGALPLSAKFEKFITAYLNTLDLDKASIEAGFQPETGRSLYKRPAIRSEIERRKKAIEAEVNHQIAKKRVVGVDALDKNLMQVVRLAKKDLVESPALAASKVKAIELGYQRVGLLVDGNFIPDASTEVGKPDEAPRIFRSAEQSILTHQITETRQIVTTKEILSSSAPAKPSPPTIDADAWADF